jgi:putative chitinase
MPSAARIHFAHHEDIMTMSRAAVAALALATAAPPDAYATEIPTKAAFERPFSLEQDVTALNRKAFFDAVRQDPCGGSLTIDQVRGMDAVLDVYEASFRSRTSLTQFAYMLGTAFHETACVMQPIQEYGNAAYFKRMYDLKGSRPKVAKALGNIQPGDGAKFPGMGYVQCTGRGNARKATKRLRELGVIGQDIDFEKTPELLMRPDLAAAVMFIGMEEGWFTGLDVDDIIDDRIDGDEHADFLRARRIINGTDRAERIAMHASAFLKALIAASKPIPALKVA